MDEVALFSTQEFDEQLPVARLPALPLLRRIAVRQDDIAEIMGVDRRTIQRWLVDGLSFAKADELACSRGLHPIDVWGDLWTREVAGG